MVGNAYHMVHAWHTQKMCMVHSTHVMASLSLGARPHKHCCQVMCMRHNALHDGRASVAGVSATERFTQRQPCEHAAALIQ